MTTRSSLAARALLGAYVLVLLGASWQRWGNPVSDVGLDLTIAAHWTDGLVPYRDVRYWYGPLGIGGLTAAFTLFGASLWTAIGVGFVTTAAIAELSRRIARRWLAPLPALGVVALVLSIAFSGTLFDFVLPHTFAATTGLVALLAVILALTHRRFAWAGAALAATALARPEFLAFGIAALGGAALGMVREAGWGAAIRAGLRSLAVAALIAVPPYLWLASLAGAHRLFLENIFPVEFLRAVGGTFEQEQHPLDLPSFGTLLARGTLMVGGAWIALRLLALVLGRGVDASAAATPAGWWLRTGRVLAALAAALVVAMVLAVVGGDAGEPVRLIKADVTRLIIAMTPMAAIGLGALAWGAVAWLRSTAPPLEEPGEDGPGWVAAGALLATAGACGLRSYGIFSTDVYASYYAPPVVIVVAILAVRLARRTGPRPELAAALVLAAGATSLSAHAILGLYRDKTVRVPTPVGTFKTSVEGGENVRAATLALVARVRPGERLLTLPQEPGFLFLSRTRPTLYEATFLPGVLATPEADRAAARTLLQGAPDRAVPGYEPPRFVMESVWNFKQWGFRANGDDVNVELHRAIVSRYRVVERIGDTERLPPPYTIGQAFTLYERR